MSPDLDCINVKVSRRNKRSSIAFHFSKEQYIINVKNILFSTIIMLQILLHTIL